MYIYVIIDFPTVVGIENMLCWQIRLKTILRRYGVDRENVFRTNALP